MINWFGMLATNQSIFYFMSVHIEMILDPHNNNNNNNNKNKIKILIVIFPQNYGQSISQY